MRVSGSYRIYRSSGYGYGSVIELTEVPGRYKNAVPVARGICGTSVQSLQKFRVQVFFVVSYRTYTSSRYGYECPTELTEVPGTGMSVLQNLQKFFVG